AGRYLAMDRRDIPCREPAAEQRFQTFEKRLNVVAGSVDLQSRFAHKPALAERLPVGAQPLRRLGLTGLCSVETGGALEGARQTRHASLGERCRKEPGMSRPARMQGLHSRTLVHELDYAACLAAGDSDRVRHLLAVELQQEACRERSRKRSAHRGELEAT